MANILQDAQYIQPNEGSVDSAGEYYYADGRTPEPTNTEPFDLESSLKTINKKKNMAAATVQKSRAIGKPGASLVDKKKEMYLDSIHDADGPGIRGYGPDDVRDSSSSGKWYDEFENSQFGIDNKSPNAVMKQRQLAAGILGKDIMSVSDQDIIDLGNKATIQKLYEHSRKKGDSDWEAPYIQNSELPILGDKDNPLNIPILGSNMGKDKNGRTLMNISNPSTGVNTSDVDADNPLKNIYANSGSGKYLTKAQKLAVLEGNSDRTGYDDGIVGEFADTTQSSLIGARANINKLANQTVDALSVREQFDWFDENIMGINPEERREYIKKATDPETGQAFRDAETGVSQATRDKQTANNKSSEALQKQADASWESGDYKSFVKQKSEQVLNDVLNSPTAIGDSMGEMAELAIGAPGIAMATGVRVDKNTDDYIKNNNGDTMPKDEVALAVVLNALSLSGERLILKTGIGRATSSILGKSSIGQKIAGFLGSSAGEYTQERFDYTIEEFMGRDRSKDGDMSAEDVFAGIWDSPGARQAGTAGGTTGAVMQGGIEVAVEGTKGTSNALDGGLGKIAEDRLTRKIKDIKAKSKAKADGDKAEATELASQKAEAKQEMYTAGVEDAAKQTEEEVAIVYESLKESDPELAEAYRQGTVGEELTSEVDETADIQQEMYDAGVEDAANQTEAEVTTVYETLKESDPELAESYLKGSKGESLNIEPSIVSDEELQKHYDESTNPAEKAELKKRLDNASMSTSETDQKAQLKADMEAGLTVETVETKDGTRDSIIANRKDKKYAPHEVTDDMLMSIPEGSYDKSAFQKVIKAVTDTKLIQRISKKFRNSSDPQQEIARINKDIQATFKDSTALDGLVDKQGKGAQGKALRIAALTLGAIQSAITSENDISKNAGVNRSDGQARLDGLVQQLGKDYMNSYGLKYSGDPVAMAKRYAEIGSKMLNFMAETGMVQTQEGQVVATDITSKDGKAKSKKDLYKGRSTVETMGSHNKPVMMLQTDTVSLTDNQSKSREVASDNANNLSLLNRLLSPTNYQLPSKQAKTEVPSDQDIGILHESIIKKYNGLKYNIKPEFVEVLKKIKKLVDDKYDGDFDVAMRKSSIIKGFIAAENSFATINKPKEEGRERFRGDNLRSLLDNLDGLTEGDGRFNFSYFSAINQRIHVMETILDYQGDKFMARQIVSGGEYTTENENESNALYEDVGENVMFMFDKESRDEINDTSTTPERALEIYKDQLNNPNADILDAFKNMNNKGGLSLEYLEIMTNKVGEDSPFSLLNNLQAWKDIFDAEDKNLITSSHMIEFDATASGVVNTLLNLSADPRVRKVLSQIGIMYKGNSEGTSDPYGWLNKTVAEQDTFVSSGLKTEIQRINDLGISLRNLAKYPVMKWFYGQEETNVAQEMSSELAYDVINKAINGSLEAMAEVNRITGKNYTQSGYDYSKGAAFEAESNKQSMEQNTPQVRNISDADIATMENYYTENVSKHYVAALEKAFPGVIQYRNKMAKIYDSLQKTGKWKGRLGTGMQAMHSGDKGAKKMSVQKNKQYMEEAPAGFGWLMMNDQFNNHTSLGVNPQHSSDGTQLLGGLDEAMKYNSDSGIMSVHDAVYASPKSAILIKGRYENDTVELAEKYDYVGAALKELQDAINLMPEKKDDGYGKKISNVDKAARQSELNEMQAEYDATRSDKTDYLNDVTTNIFGSKTVKTDFNKEDVSTSQEKKTNKSPETKAEPKVDPKKEIAKKNNEKLNEFNEVAVDLKEAINDGNIMGLMDILKTFKGKISAESEIVLQRVIDALNTQQVSDIGVDKKKGYSGGYGAITFPSDISVQPVGNLDMTLDKFVEVVGHEVDHAINLRYIQDQIVGKKANSSEILYIQKVLSRLPNMIKNNKFMDDKVAERLEYMLKPKQATAIKKMSEDNDINERRLNEIFRVTEFVSMMRNEPDVRNAVLEAFGNNQSIMDKIISLVQKAYEFVRDMGPEAVSKLMTESRKDNNFAASNMMIAVESLQANAAVATDAANSKGVLTNANYGKNKKNKNDPYEGDQWADVNPRHYAQYVISKQNSLLSKFLFGIGGGAVDLAAPWLLAGHRKLNTKSDLYRGATSLIRTGFWESEMANKMKVMIGITGDVDEKMMNEFLSLGTDIIQKSHDLATKNLPQLDKKIKEAYPEPKDQVRVYQLFAKTGIADLASNPEIISDLLDGKKTIDEMIKELTKKWTPEEVKESKGLATYYITGKTDTNLVNTSNRGLFSKNARQAVALMALNQVSNGQNMLVDMNKSLRNELLELAIIVKSTNDSINHQAPRADGKPNEQDPEYNDDYDGHYSMDVHDKIYEYKTVNEQDMRHGKYSADKDWVVIKEPSQGHIGVVAREMIGAGNTPGIGLNLNRFENGFFLDSDETLTLKNKLDKMENQKPGSSQTYLEDNNIVKLKGRYKFIVDEKTKRDKLGLVQSAAHSLYRTMIHNKELIEMQSVRDIVLDKGTDNIEDATQMKGLSNLITRNKNGTNEERANIPMFLNIKYDYGSYDSLPRRIKDMYRRPENLSTYNNFNQKVTLVRKDMADQLVGHQNFQIFGGDNRKMARTEQIFKGLVVHSKMMMVVTAPFKLAVDVASNIGILGAMDVSVFDMPKQFKKSFKEYKSFSHLRSQLVQAEIAAFSGNKKAIKLRDSLQNKIEKHSFYKAFQSGFIQSYSTDLMVKEFDTISGLQSDIDNLVKYLATSKDGKKNEVHKAMKWWMDFGSDYGFTVDALLKTASAKTALDGTAMGDTMIEMAERLKSTRDGEDMSKYVSNMIGAPSSEIVSAGGSIMVISDALSKKVLADALQKQIDPRTKKRYTEDDAYMKANQTFIDFRVNMPSEVKALSDYGILMFPSFWMKTQRVIAGLIMYHPIPAVGGYLAEYTLGVQQTSILDANVVSKIYDENVFHAPGEAVELNHISPFAALFG